MRSEEPGVQADPPTVIEQRRLDAGLSKSRLALLLCERVGVSVTRDTERYRRSIYRWVNGETEPSEEFARHLAAILGGQPADYRRSSGC